MGYGRYILQERNNVLSTINQLKQKMLLIERGLKFEFTISAIKFDSMYTNNMFSSWEIWELALTVDLKWTQFSTGGLVDLPLGSCAF